MNIKNSGGPVLDQKVADQMLSNIFEACHVQPNSIPLEVLTSYSNYRKERFAFQKFTLMLIIILFCMLPFLHIPFVKRILQDEYNPFRYRDNRKDLD